MIGSSNKAYLALRDVLDLPKHCVSFSLEAKAGEMLILKTLSFVDGGRSDEMVTVLQKFDLVERVGNDKGVTTKPT